MPLLLLMIKTLHYLKDPSYGNYGQLSIIINRIRILELRGEQTALSLLSDAACSFGDVGPCATLSATGSVNRVQGLGVWGLCRRRNHQYGLWYGLDIPGISSRCGKKGQCWLDHAMLCNAIISSRVSGLRVPREPNTPSLGKTP